MDVPLKTPEEPKERSNHFAVAEQWAAAGKVSVFANKDIALLICRKLDQRSLGRLAQCSRLLRGVAERARRELVQRSVFSVEQQVDSSVSMAQLFAAHYSVSMLRLSAVYDFVTELWTSPPQWHEGDVVDRMNMEMRMEGPLRFIDRILLEIRVGDKQAMVWCTLSREHQIPVLRRLYLD